MIFYSSTKSGKTRARRFSDKFLVTGITQLMKMNNFAVILEKWWTKSVCPQYLSTGMSDDQTIYDRVIEDWISNTNTTSQKMEYILNYVTLSESEFFSLCDFLQPFKSQNRNSKHTSLQFKKFYIMKKVTLYCIRISSDINKNKIIGLN